MYYMLVLTRAVGQTLTIGDHIKVTVEFIEEKKALICIEVLNFIQDSDLNKSLQIIPKKYYKRVYCVVGEIIEIGRDIKIRIKSVKGNQLTIAIDADKSIQIIRPEASRKIMNTNFSCLSG